jgi:glycerol-3-phosphate dehydrogenase (NAD(P)+)
MRVVVLGAGSWGTTLASLLSAAHDTTLWARDAEVADEVVHRHRNTAYLPEVDLTPSLAATDDPAAALDGAELVVVAVPSAYLRPVVELAGPHLPPTAALVSVTKGIEIGSGARMTQVIAQVTGRDQEQICALSGPNLAREVVVGRPSFSVLACTNPDLGELVSQVMTTESFRVFTNPDVVGCEIGGAVKNVMAIAAGIGDGLGFGWNTKAALITRGLTEIARLGAALGANPITFLGLAGNGDLIATCASPQSRNRHVGEELGRGRPLSAVIGDMNMVAEGVVTTPAIVELAQSLDVPMPITRRVDAVLNGDLSPTEAVHHLMHYEPGSELDDLT